MDRELGFDMYTIKLLSLVALAVTVCSCTVFASIGFYEILHRELMMHIPAWQSSVLWVSFVYVGLYMGVRLVGRAGWRSLAEPPERAVSGEPNIFAELGASDLPNLDIFGKF